MSTPYKQSPDTISGIAAFKRLNAALPGHIDTIMAHLETQPASMKTALIEMTLAITCAEITKLAIKIGNLAESFTQESTKKSDGTALAE